MWRSSVFTRAKVIPSPHPCSFLRPSRDAHAFDELINVERTTPVALMRSKESASLRATVTDTAGHLSRFVNPLSNRSRTFVISFTRRRKVRWGSSVTHSNQKRAGLYAAPSCHSAIGSDWYGRQDEDRAWDAWSPVSPAAYRSANPDDISSSEPSGIWNVEGPFASHVE